MGRQRVDKEMARVTVVKFMIALIGMTMAHATNMLDDDASDLAPIHWQKFV